MHAPRSLLALALPGVLALAGCLRGDPLEWKVRAPNPRALFSWRMTVDSAMGVENCRRLNEALQEIRLNVAAGRAVDRWLGQAVRPSMDDIEEAMCRRVHDQSLRTVLQLGCELRVIRLKEELAALENAVKVNAELITKPGDVDSRHFLEGFRERQGARAAKCRADLANAERELAPLLRAGGRRLLEPSTDQMGEVVAKPR